MRWTWSAGVDLSQLKQKSSLASLPQFPDSIEYPVESFDDACTCGVTIDGSELWESMLGSLADGSWPNCIR